MSTEYGTLPSQCASYGRNHWDAFRIEYLAPRQQIQHISHWSQGIYRPDWIMHTMTNNADAVLKVLLWCSFSPSWDGSKKTQCLYIFSPSEPENTGRGQNEVRENRIVCATVLSISAIFFLHAQSCHIAFKAVILRHSHGASEWRLSDTSRWWRHGRRKFRSPVVQPVPQQSSSCEPGAPMNSA